MFYLPPSTLSILSTLNNSREIQQLPIKVKKKKKKFKRERDRERGLSQQLNIDSVSARRKKSNEKFTHQSMLWYLMDIIQFEYTKPSPPKGPQQMMTTMLTYDFLKGI
jgi:hypothetical protein